MIGMTVETLRKPSTGLKLKLNCSKRSLLLSRDTQKTQHGIETNELFRYPPSTDGSRHSENPARGIEGFGTSCRDTQKTQHGIETSRRQVGRCSRSVETLRKPSTGLKHDVERCRDVGSSVETLRKPSTG